MTITIFGASGHVGQLVVKAALAEGIHVRAFIHKSNPFGHKTNLAVMRGDITDAAAVREAIKGSDAVISTLGSWGRGRHNVVSTGAQNIVPAMQKLGVRRLITVTGTTAQTSQDTPRLIDKLNRQAFALVAGNILRDGDEHIKILEASDLDWTCVRSPAMLNGKSRAYTLSPVPKRSPLATVTRQAVAQCLLDLALSKAEIQRAPHIRR